MRQDPADLDALLRELLVEPALVLHKDAEGIVVGPVEADPCRQIGCFHRSAGGTDKDQDTGCQGGSKAEKAALCSLKHLRTAPSCGARAPLARARLHDVDQEKSTQGQGTKKPAVHERRVIPTHSL